MAGCCYTVFSLHSLAKGRLGWSLLDSAGHQRMYRGHVQSHFCHDVHSRGQQGGVLDLSSTSSLLQMCCSGAATAAVTQPCGGQRRQGLATLR